MNGICTDCTVTPSRVDGVLEAFEPHALGHERRDHIDKMRERPAQAIELPDDQGITRAQLF